MSNGTTKSRRMGRPPKMTVEGEYRQWAVRFRDHMARHRLTQEKLGIEMGKRLRPDKKPLSQGTIGHWLTGRSDITLVDFLVLCEVAQADPAMILFEKELAELLAELTSRHALQTKERRTSSPSSPPAKPVKGLVSDTQ